VAALQVGTASIRSEADQHQIQIALFAAAIAAPLVIRRRWPLVALAAVLAIAFSSPVDVPFEFPMLIVIYTIGTTGSWEMAIAGLIVAVFGGAAVYADGGDVNTSNLIALTLESVIATGIGAYIGSRRRRVEELSERAERLDRERELLAERAVADERVRIAQELHDVVAHNVSLIVVQAQALGATVSDERVTEATTGIADLGRQAMAEMHRTLKLLRANEDKAATRGPQPGLGDLEGLVERARAAGLRVEVAVEGQPRALSQGVDLSAYRIVQEALTNVVKHADGADTTVTLGYRADALELAVIDDGNAALRPTARADGAGGHGIVGMRERAALFGGTLTAGPRRGDGFEVHGVLPYGDGSSA
jgi:signal transduction histidine kinase